MEFSVGSSAGSPAPVASLRAQSAGRSRPHFPPALGLAPGWLSTHSQRFYGSLGCQGFSCPPQKKTHKSGKNYAKRWDYNSLFPIEMILERINLFIGLPDLPTSVMPICSATAVQVQASAQAENQWKRKWLCLITGGWVYKFPNSKGALRALWLFPLR